MPVINAKRTFLDKEERLLQVESSPSIQPNEVKEQLERDMKPLVDSFAKQLRKEEGLRDDVVVLR